MKTTLLISDQQAFIERLSRFLNTNHHNSKTAYTLDDGLHKMKQISADVVFCDVPILSNTDHSQVLTRIKAINPDVPVIFMTENLKMDKAIDLVKAGLYTCINKPFHSEELLRMIEEVFAAEKNRLKDIRVPVSPNPDSIKVEALPLPKEMYIKGISKSSRNLYKQIDLVGKTNMNVIIYGETGTGKESVARRLLSTSKKSKGPFVAIDCGCLSRELAGSELFGHEKGAFTGALHARVGAFEMANQGTIFLDEIGNLDYQVQTFLLRAIQERKIRRVGGDREIDVNVRILVASNEHLYELVKKGLFREDLYHRLNEFEIVIPPLRERKEDIRLFLDFFLERSNEELDKNVPGFSDEALKVLGEYNWPGNIREVKNTVKRTCLLALDHELIDLKLLPYEIRHNLQEYTEMAQADTAIPENEDIPEVRADSNLKEKAAKAELSEILKVLKKVNFNKTKAAAILKIDRKTLYNKLNLIKKKKGPFVLNRTNASLHY